MLSAKFLATSSASALQTRLQGAFDFLKTLEQDDNTLVGLDPLARVLAGNKCLQHKNQVRSAGWCASFEGRPRVCSQPVAHQLTTPTSWCRPHRTFDC